MSRNGFLERAAGNHSTVAHKRAPKQEKAWAKKGNGKLTPGSGNKAIKGDVQKYNGLVRIECKTTGNNSFSVTRDMVKKLEEAALASDEVPAIIIEFLDDIGRPVREVAVVPTWILDMLEK